MRVSARRGWLMRLALVLPAVLLLAGCGSDSATRPSSGSSAAKPTPWIGIYLRAVELEPATATGGAGGGILVDAVVPGGPADSGGIREGDIIVSLGGAATRDSESLVKSLDGKVGTALPADVLRNGERGRVSVTPVLRPSGERRSEPVLTVRLAEERLAARMAERAVDRPGTFQHSVAAIRFALIQTEHGVAGPAAADAIDEALVRIGGVLPALSPRPEIPSEAARHTRRAIEMLRSAKTDADTDSAYEAFLQALYHAPFVAELWLNAGLAAERGGHAESAHRHLRRNLILDPSSPDAPAIKRRLTALEPLIAERKPWLPYLGIHSYPDKHTEEITLRGRRLELRAVSPSAAGSDRGDKPGDLIAHGTIGAGKLDGKWVYRQSNRDVIRCFTPEFETDAEFTIDPAGGQLVITTTSDSYDTGSCAVSARNRATTRRISPRTISAPGS